MKKQSFLFVGITLCLILSIPLSGQETGLLRIDPERLDSGGEASLWGGIEEGWFRPEHAGTFQWSAGAGAKGVRHGKNTSWTGAISLEQMMGKDMTSSLFLEPGYYPMDIVEFRNGTKSRQTGRLEGGVLREVGYEWAFGIKASFQAANSAKQTELSHSAFGMEARVEPVVTYIMDDDMGLVSSYHVGLRTERIKMDKSDGDLPAFLDNGLRYGSYVDGLSLFPVRELSHGFDELYHSPEFSAGFGITWKRGQAGEQDGTRFLFPGSTMKVFFEHTILADRADHVYRIAYRRMRDQLREPVTGEGSSDGFRALSDRTGRNLNLRYGLRFLGGALKNIALELDGNSWNERSLLYSDRTRRYDGTAKFLSSFSFGPVRLDLNVLAAKGWWKDRGLAGKEEGSVSQSNRLTDSWLRKTEFVMAPRVGTGGTITCDIPPVPGLYVQLDASWLHALKVYYIGGQNRETATLKVGYRF